MKKNRRKAWIIFALYGVATCLLLLVDWEYPAPIANSFTYGGISLSAEAAFCAAALAVAALLACIILVRKDPALRRSGYGKASLAVQLAGPVAFGLILLTDVF